MDLKFEQITRACSLFTFLIVAPSLLAVFGVGAAGCRLKLQLFRDLAGFGVEASENQRREGRVEVSCAAAARLAAAIDGRCCSSGGCRRPGLRLLDAAG